MNKTTETIVYGLVMIYKDGRERGRAEGAGGDLLCRLESSADPAPRRYEHETAGAAERKKNKKK